MKTTITGVLFFAVIALSWAAATKRETHRLVLSPAQQFEIAAAATPSDSIAVAFTVAAPVAHKYQRHRCVISGNRKFILQTTPLRRWALRGDTLMVLSEIDLTLRARADSSQPLVLKFDFVNLDAKPEARGTAAVVIATGAKAHAPAQQAKIAAPPATTPAPAIPSDTTAKTSAAIAAVQSNPVKKDSAAIPAAGVSDSATAQAQVQSTSATTAESTAAQGEGGMWVLIALLLLGIALIALVNIAGRMKAPTFTERTRSRLEPMAAPLVNHVPPAAEAAVFASASSQSEGAPETKANVVAHEEGAGESLSVKEVLPWAPSAVPVIDLFAEARMPLVTPAGLQDALSKLRDITSATQKALTVQSQVLEQFSRQTESVRGFLLENPAPPEKTAAAVATLDTSSRRNGPDRAPAETKPAEISLRVLPAEEKDENFEEVASAIDGLIAASATKPLTSPAAAISRKAETLRRIGSGLQELTGICRALGLAAPLTNVESLARKALDLQVSCEAWLADQSIKLSFSLPRSSSAGAPARREIVDSIVDSLYETRKIAVQGPIYFERRVTQLLDYDLPKLRQQLKEIENEEMRRVWEAMTA